MFHEVIKDEDVGYKNKELVDPKKRVGARGIVEDGNNKIAIVYKEYMNEYKLPGGGVEAGEEIEDAFCREIMEETGCKVKIIEKLGVTEEFKGNSNFYQISHIFRGRVETDTHKLNYTEKETAENAKLFWLELDDAIGRLEKCFENLKSSPCDKYENEYSIRFEVKRDLMILRNYKKLIKK